MAAGATLNDQYLTGDRPGMLLHIHDSRRRRREACCGPEVSGRILARVEGQLHDLAGGADPKLSSHTHSVPDRKLRLMTERAPCTDLARSLSSLPLVSHGPFTFRLPTPPMRFKLHKFHVALTLLDL